MPNTNDLYYITIGYLIKSSNIKVFPSAYRDTNIDPESRLNTEASLTHLSGFSANSDSYIINYVKTENNVTFELMLGGYYFKFTLPELPSIDDSLYVYIDKTDRILHQIDDINITTKTLNTFYQQTVTPTPGTANLELDIKIDGTSYFTGLLLSTQANLAYSNCLKICESVDGMWALYAPNKSIAIKNGTAIGALCLNNSLNSSTGQDSLAAGKNTEATGIAATAFGLNTEADGRAAFASGIGTTASSEAQHVFGRYNIEDVSERYIEIVGNGTADLLTNARTLDWQGNETLAGDLLANGNILGTNLALTGTSLNIQRLPVINTSEDAVIFNSTTGDLARRSLLKDTDTTATTAAGNSFTYVDTVHTDNSGYISETRKTTTIADGGATETQAQFLVNDTAITVKGLTNTDEPTFKALTVSGLASSKIVMTNNSSKLTTKDLSDSSTAAKLSSTSTNLVTERDIYHGLPTINNSHEYTSNTTLYAPTAGGVTGALLVGTGIRSTPDWLALGTAGQILTSRGSGANPSWQNITSANNTATWGGTITVGTVAGTDLKFTMPTNPNTDNSVTAVNNHYTPSGGSNLTVSSSGTATRGSTNVLTNIKIDAAGHITGGTWYKLPASDNTDTKNTAGATNNTTDTLYLIGATNQNSNPQTYTRSAIFATKDGELNANSFNANSDIRLKENIKQYSSEKSILSLPIVEFDYKADHSHQIGCIAQDLQKICPELVVENENGYLAVKESKLVYLLILEIQKLNNKINLLEAKIKE